MGKTKYTADFKKKVALEALKEQKTLAQIAKEYQVHPAQVSLWRKDFQEGTLLVGEKRQEKSREEEIAVLERKVGKLTIENDFLKKKLGYYQQQNGRSW